MASFRGLIKKGLKYDPLTAKLAKAESGIPGSVGAGITALTADNVSSNPYKEGEASRWDIFAGGKDLSKKEENRNIGRTIGTAAALFFTAGAAGASTSTSAGIAAQGASAVQAQSEAVIAEREGAAAAKAQQDAFSKSLESLRKSSTGTPSIDEARRRAERSDVMRRRRGRGATLLTGPTGVGQTPVSQRSLIGT
jgi:hypothetical protein